MTAPPPRISGFTIVRNATLLDYPFEECIQSLRLLCDEIIINCGDSDDDTWERCQRLQQSDPARIRIFKTVWERKNQQGGYQLKAQTDAALARCTGRWCVYLQADEVLHEKDVPALRSTMTRADARDDVDGLVFDYLHFYGNYDYVITGRNWYRREVRALKNGRGIQAFRDAQGFRRNGKRLLALHSGARVFHYGHVRCDQGLKQKATQMAQWWGETPVDDAEKLVPRRHVGLKRFTGPHPEVMRARLQTNAQLYDPMKCRRVWNRDELKNAITLAWESVFPWRIGEFRNYELVR